MKEQNEQLRNTNISRKQRLKIKNDAKIERKLQRENKRKNNKIQNFFVPNDLENSIFNNLSKTNKTNETNETNEINETNETNDLNNLSTSFKTTITKKCEKCAKINLRKCICLNCKKNDCCGDNEYCIFWILD